MIVKHHLPLKLDEADRWILDQVSKELGISKTELCRWAIRFYAMRGPWFRDGDPLHRRIMEHYGRCQVGPGYVEETQ